ncbi:hypothetical protein O9G_006145, partial [Rozella allomycis CSF55]
MNLANDRLNMNLKDVNKKYNQSINEVESLKIQNNGLKTKEIYYNDAIQKLNERENEMEKMLVNKEQDIENARKEIIEKNEIINEQTNKINYFEYELEKERDSFTDKFEKLVAENEQIKQEYENKIEISMQKMYELLELKNTIENELNTKMVELERQQDEINDCKHNLALKSNELLKAENEELNEKLLIAESEKDVLHPEFENQLHDIKKLNEEQVEKLKSSILLLKEENSKLKEEIEEFRQRVNELSCNKSDKEEVQEKLKKAEESKKSLNDEMQRIIQESKNNYLINQDNLNTLNQIISDLKNEKESNSI